jgi:ubiquinone/menaquinone biosynthesis C-methylase UbiE
VADAVTVELPDGLADAALISMVLHHTDDPAGILRNVARLLKPGARTVVAEFHPDGPCQQGPPRDQRLDAHQVRTWCEAAGLSLLSEKRQSPEHYMLVVQPRE